jgi:type III secretion system (T3SS) SseB-like protein
VLGIGGGDPAFRDDDGSADPSVTSALAEFAGGRGSEHDVLLALGASRLLVPVVAVLADDRGLADGPGLVDGSRVPDRMAEAGDQVAGDPDSAALRRAGQGDKATDMALPTLVGLDGRRAIPAFTSLDSLTRWQADARPVPVIARAACQTACAESAAVVIDVAGPVPFAIEGARLAALARGEEPPPAWADPDVREIVAAVLAGRLDVASFELEDGGDDYDLAVVLTLAGPATAEWGGRDLADLGGAVVAQVMSRLGGRLRRGVGIWLSEVSVIDQ